MGGAPAVEVDVGIAEETVATGDDEDIAVGAITVEPFGNNVGSNNRLYKWEGNKN